MILTLVPFHFTEQGEAGRFRRGPSWRRMFKNKEGNSPKGKGPHDMAGPPQPIGSGDPTESPYRQTPGSPAQRSSTFAGQRSSGSSSSLGSQTGTGENVRTYSC